MRNNFIWKHTLPTKRKVNSFQATMESYKSSRFIVLNACCTFGIARTVRATTDITCRSFL